jgi:hypothetical protein
MADTPGERFATMAPMVRRLPALLVFLLVLSVPPAAQAQVIEAAAQRLQSEPLYVHPSVRSHLAEREERRLRRLMRESPVPMYVAILPTSAAAEAGGTERGALIELSQEVDGRGIFALALTGDGGSFIAGSNHGIGDPRVAQAATEAVEAHRGEGVGPVVTEFVERANALSGADAAAETAREAPPSGAAEDGGVGAGTIILLGGGVLAAGAYFMMRRERRRLRVDALQEAKDNAHDDLIALGDDIRSLDIDVEMPGTPRKVIDDYSVAVAAYERAESAWEAARTPEDLEPVSMALEEGRWAMASAKARLEGREPPLRRAPCFFDPRHGPSSREVEWAPPYGAPRMVPACEADAQRVEHGEDPHARQILVGGQPTPYWNAGPAYAPFAGGFFGGASAGLLPSLLVGSMLGVSVGSMFAAGDAFAADGADFAGGDFGGGDFGAGDFGGADFGAGDFGGGDF